jgi:antitoxin (DNA-binding transcriptional repressor) of toxin-antitoxin stability system
MSKNWNTVQLRSGDHMVTAIDVRELPARLEEALALTASGAEVILFDGLTPRARLVPLALSAPRAAGLHLGALVPTANFDAPLPDDFWAGQS